MSRESSPTSSLPTAFTGIYRIGDLEIDQDKDFERHEWRAERIGWGLIGLIVLTALLGLFSSGPLSQATTGNPQESIGVRYERYARKMAPTALEVQIGAKAGRESKARVWFSRTYLEQFELLNTTPEPESVEASQDHLTYTFAVPNPGEPTSVTLHLRAERPGIFDARIGLVDGPSFPIKQYVYP